MPLAYRFCTLCLVLVAALGSPRASEAQTIALFEDFEDATVTYTTSDGEFTDGTADFFIRTDGSNITSAYEVSNFNGSFYFAAQDIDGEGGPDVQTLTFGGIDITGLTALTFSALFAEDDDGANQDYDEPDYVRVFAAIDGGAPVQIFGIENDGSTFNSAPFVDTDLDGTGEGTEIISRFVEFGAAIPGTGSSLDLTIEIALDAGDEDIAIDDVTVEGETTNLPPVIVSQPGAPIVVSVGDPINFVVEFTPPEQDQELLQIKTQFFGGLTLSDLVCSTVFGDPGEVSTTTCSGAASTPGTYTVEITATDKGTPNLSTTATVELIVEGIADDTPPECSAIALGAGPFSGNTAAFVTAQDAESGIASLTYKLKNAQGFYDAGGGVQGPFADGEEVMVPGTPTGPVTIGAEKIDDGKRARIVVVVTNGLGLEATCDPVMTTLDGEQPRAFALGKNYPNPFNPTTMIRFELPEASAVTLAVYDPLGRRVATLVNESLAAGRYEVQWDGRSDAGATVAGGVYLYQITAGEYRQTRQMTLVK